MWPLLAAKDRHSKAHNKSTKEVKEIFEIDEVLDEFNSDEEEKDKGSVPMPVFDNIRSHLASPLAKVGADVPLMKMLKCLEIQVR